MLSYVLVTAARDEEEHIGNLLRCVEAQTVRPLKWVIVSDGSTDRTEEIVRKHASRQTWIELIARPKQTHRDFASKVHSFNAGYERVKPYEFDIIGNLDADLTFDAEYMAYLLDKFSCYEHLGVAGTPFVEGSNFVYDYRFTNIEHVSGGCQLFRRECFEAVGGFSPVKDGGEDWIAVTTARMLGWQTRTFMGKHFVHHRRMGQAKMNVLRAMINTGRNDYLFGNHPLWELFRICYQFRNKPYFIGGAAIMCGYLGTMIRREPKPISSELVSFNQREQLRRLRSAFGRFLTCTRSMGRTSPDTDSQASVRPGGLGE
jgi:glycosyltransferase involved in cell wall biosynthesis